MVLRTRTTKPFKFLAVLLCLAMALYAGYWYWLAQNFESVMHQWQTNMADKQASLTYDSLTVSGFPGKVSVNVKNMTLIQQEEVAWFFPLFRIRVNPLNMNALEIVAPQTNRLEAASPTFNLSMAFDNMVLAHAYNIKEQKQDITLEVDNLAFNNPADKSALDRFRLDLTITPPIYTPISSYAALKRWHESNGTVTLNRLLLERDNITVESDGTLSLSTTFQPRFNGTISIVGVIELLTQMQEEKIINEQMAGLTTSFITMLNGGKTPQANQPLLAPVVINETGILTIGPFPILTVPPINWNAL